MHSETVAAQSDSPPILLVSSSLDFATDYIVAVLRRRGAPYYRADLDLLAEDQISLDPVAPELQIASGNRVACFTNTTLRAVLYRAPTHLRESSGGRHSGIDLLQRHQWAAFARSLAVFDRASWVNHPHAVYAAECKPLQLLAAHRCGFITPSTVVTNAIPRPASALWDDTRTAALKALDSFLVRIGGQDAFLYTRRVAAEALEQESFAQMPAILQHWLENKVDVRVTVVGSRCYPASITYDAKGLDGDWRTEKHRVEFKKYILPPDVANRCIELVRSLKLRFAAIDLACVDSTYYFLEVNPTGEWAWLLDPTGMRIDEAIADLLCNPAS